MRRLVAIAVVVLPPRPRRRRQRGRDAAGPFVITSGAGSGTDVAAEHDVVGVPGRPRARRVVRSGLAFAVSGGNPFTLAGNSTKNIPLACPSARAGTSAACCTRSTARAARAARRLLQVACGACLDHARRDDVDSPSARSRSAPRRAAARPAQQRHRHDREAVLPDQRPRRQLRVLAAVQPARPVRRTSCRSRPARDDQRAVHAEDGGPTPRRSGRDRQRAGARPGGDADLQRRRCDRRRCST